MIVFLIYIVLGYWAIDQTIYRNRVIISTGFNIFFTKLIYAALFGWALIPWAIIRNLLSR